MIRLVEVFGLHFLTLDIRQHSSRHARAIDEIFAWAGICTGYLKLKPSERFDLLVGALQQKRPVLPAYLSFSAETQEVVQTFRTISAMLEQQCPEAIEYYIISGCTEPAHLYRSHDLGGTWEELPALRRVDVHDKWSFPAPPHLAHVKHIAFDPRDSQRMFVCIEQGALLRSDDGGESFRELQFQDRAWQWFCHNSLP